jgi:hypothetical protein
MGITGIQGFHRTAQWLSGPCKSSPNQINDVIIIHREKLFVARFPHPSSSSETLIPKSGNRTQPGAAESIPPSTGMAIARTGVYVDDYLECEIAGSDLFPFSFPFGALLDLLPLLASYRSADSSTLAGDLQRILSTMHELDERAHGDDFATHSFFFPLEIKIHFENLIKKVIVESEFCFPSLLRSNLAMF